MLPWQQQKGVIDRKSRGFLKLLSVDLQICNGRTKLSRSVCIEAVCYHGRPVQELRQECKWQW